MCVWISLPPFIFLEHMCARHNVFNTFDVFIPINCLVPFEHSELLASTFICSKELCKSAVYHMNVISSSSLTSFWHLLVSSDAMLFFHCERY